MVKGLDELQKALFEKLAELEHDQWVKWSMSIEPDIDIVHGKGWDRLQGWRKLWVPYSRLTEEQKEQDRIWARKSLELFSAFQKDFVSKQKLSEQVQARKTELQGSQFKVYGDSIRQLDWVLSLLEEKVSGVEEK